VPVGLGPFPFASAITSCHQKSKEHMQLGWVVRWVLSTPPGPPRGWAVRPCRASTPLAPLCFVLAPRACVLRLGAKAPLPLRASSPGVLPGGGAVLSPVTGTPIPAVCLSWLTIGSSSRQIKANRSSASCSTVQASPALLPSPTKLREVAHGLFSDALENGSPQVRSFGFQTGKSPRSHKSQITSLSLTAACVFPPPTSEATAWTSGI
jgi:hypothetical protein